MPWCCLRSRKVRQGGNMITVTWNNKCWCPCHWQNKKGNGRSIRAVGQLAGQTVVEGRKTGWFIVVNSKVMHVTCRKTMGPILKPISVISAYLHHLFEAYKNMYLSPGFVNGLSILWALTHQGWRGRGVLGWQPTIGINPESVPPYYRNHCFHGSSGGR